MPYNLVFTPLTGPDAFREINNEAAQAQAAILLLLGRQLRGDDSALMARAKNLRGKMGVATLGEEDKAEFPVPTIRATSGRVSSVDVRDALARRYGQEIVSYSYPKDKPEKWAEAYADLGEKLYKKPTIESAAQLMELCLNHPDDLTRVAAASAYFSLRAEPQKLIKILASGTRSNEPLVRNVAAMTLSRVAPEHGSLRRLKGGKQPKDGREPAHTSTIVHGTFAASNTWWQPGGDFHTYLRTRVPDDLYNAPDRFGWSGGYSDRANAQAAVELVNWVSEHDVQGLELFGHSHGANVMMLATNSGLTAGKLILLSCPVHVDKYFPDFAKVERVISIHVKFDLVILVDGGGQRFNHPEIEENVVRIWFNHSATHEPDVWRDENLLEKI